MSELPFHTFKQIAIIRRNGYGDLLCAFPLIFYLKEKAPHAQITLFVDRFNSLLLPYLPPLDHTVVLPPRGNKYFHLLKVALSHRRKNFDLAISAKTSPMKLMNFFLFALGAKRKVAYCDESWHSKLIDHRVPYPKKNFNIHQGLKTLRLIDPRLEEIPEKFYPKLNVPGDIENLYLPQLKQNLPLDSHLLLTLNASTTNPKSRLSPIKYANIVNRLKKDIPIHAVVCGQQKDRERAFQIKEALRCNTSVYFPGNFDEFMVLLKASDLLFVGDGGIAHIGAGLDKHGVVLFGGVDPAIWSPLGDKTTVLFHPEHVDRIDEEEIFKKLDQAWEALIHQKHRFLKRQNANILAKIMD
jgi:ADP-heptose:LPS heptosyltransferase